MTEDKPLNISVYQIEFKLHNPITFAKSLAVEQDLLDRCQQIWDDSTLVAESVKKMMPEFMDKIMSDITIEIYKSKLGDGNYTKIGQYRPWETLQTSVQCVDW